MLAAMMVSLIIIGSAFTTFWTATQAWEKAKRRTEMFRLLEGAADVLVRQIRAMQPAFYSNGLPFVAINDGDEINNFDGITFISSANTRYPRQLAMSDLCEIQIYINVDEATDATGATGYATDQPDSSGMSDPYGATGEGVAARSSNGLYMRIDPTPDADIESGGYLLELGENITSFDCRFFDGFEWVDEWLYDYEAPEAIEFTIVVSDLEGLENPMSVTRLVTIPLAKPINAASQGAMDSMGLGTETGAQTQPAGEGASQSSTGGGESGGSGAPGGSSTGGGGSGNRSGRGGGGGRRSF